LPPLRAFVHPALSQGRIGVGGRDADALMIPDFYYK
jgi:hypothetical protein